MRNDTHAFTRPLGEGPGTALAPLSPRERGGGEVRGIVPVLSFSAVAMLSGCGRPLDLDSARIFQEAEKTFAQAKSPDDYLKAAAMYQEILDRGVCLRRGAVQPGKRLHASRPAGPSSRRLPPGAAIPGPRSVSGGQSGLCRREPAAAAGAAR